MLYPTKKIMVEFRTQIKTKISIKYINVNCKIE
jgi:hypothetical protein